MATSERPLAGRTVLVTRPEGQSEGLCELVQAAGGNPLPMPLLVIEPLADTDAAVKLARGSDWDWLVFVSANAVRYALPCPGWAGIPDGPRIAAIGKATAETLEQAGIAVDLIPKPQSNSEAMLAAPEFSDVTGRKVLIVRGEGGREHLAESLRARGALTDYAEIYRRVPAALPAEILDRWRNGGVDALIITSGEALSILMELLGKTGAELAEKTPVAVLSGRLADLARSFGWQCVAVAGEASDRGLVLALTGLLLDAEAEPPPESPSEPALSHSKPS
jgi:uroporphyrinogen-III synthase